MNTSIKRRATVGILSATILALSCVSIVMDTLASGKGNNVKAQSYKGIIREKRTNAHLDNAYRDTGKKSNPFLVKLEESEEGKGTVTRFWIEDRNENNLSNVVNVTQGKGYYRKKTYRSGCKKTVYLTAENNNYNTNVYKISGKWKEE